MLNPRSRPVDASSSRQDEAEEVRAHLAALRGGGLFLSPADARLLARWLDDGVTVGAILVALERAVEARRRRRSRVPLALSHARPHLGKAGSVAPLSTPVVSSIPGASEAPLAPLAAACRAAAAPPHDDALSRLADRLEAVSGEDPEAVARAGLEHVRAFFEACWEALGDIGRAAALANARQDLAALAGSVGEAELERLAEEVARDSLRGTWPFLTLATLLDRAHRHARRESA